MKRNRLIDSFVRMPRVAATRGLDSIAPGGLFGLIRPRRRQSSLGWFAGGAIVAAAAAAMIAPARRKSVVDLLQRAGGGIGKQLGRFVGAGVGAHPVETAKLVQGTRQLVGSAGR